ncbi:hypothetical protein [Ammoniphilus sp. YIM 78166]|uniref:hypothetical protein n=1 Tax=Ammoniphilus sp. YIM 78166 TaxID=1644106 RepID=UPI0010700F3F|nr:hypothetical protein [Ammoniphilus sp. YIM 78166]
MAVIVNVFAINVVVVNNNSGVFIGANNQAGWDSHAKFNMGTGTVFGSNAIGHNLTTLNDTDFIDAPMVNADFKPGYQTQVL